MAGPGRPGSPLSRSRRGPAAPGGGPAQCSPRAWDPLPSAPSPSCPTRACSEGLRALRKHPLVAGWCLSSGEILARTFPCPGSSGGLALLIPGSPSGALARVPPCCRDPWVSPRHRMQFWVCSEPTEALVFSPHLGLPQGLAHSRNRSPLLTPSLGHSGRGAERKSPTPEQVGGPARRGQSHSPPVLFPLPRP